MNTPDLEWLKVRPGGTANAGGTPALQGGEPPAFLRREKPALYGWFSSGRLVIVKDDTAISLDRDDLADLRRFFDQFDRGEP
jgi:hypothetical protein